MDTPTFRAAVVRTPSGPDSIEIIEAPLIEPGAGEIRVRIAAAPVNPVDLGVASGFFHDRGMIDQPAYTGLGWDFAGTVDATGPAVDLGVGTRVAGLVAGFDRDYGTYAEYIVVRASDVAVIPDELDFPEASTVPLNALAAAQILDLLGDAQPGSNRLLVTGAAGSVGSFLIPLARDRGWAVTGLARAADASFVQSLGAAFTADPEPGWDAVADTATLQEQALPLVRDSGIFVGVRPNLGPAADRGITVRAVETRPDGERLRELFARVASGDLPTRVHAVVALDAAADAHRAMANGGIRGRYVIAP